MSLQTIIDKAQQIEIDRRRIVAQTMSRSQRIKVSERNSAQPWRFTVTPPGSMVWSTNRGVIELIDFNAIILHKSV
jgi:3-methyladenine DNA glycosylase Mpg